MMRQRLILMASILLVALLGYGIYEVTLAFLHRDKVNIVIHALPTDATIAITKDNKKASGSNGDNYLDPGTYTVTITKVGFQSFTQTITTTHGDAPKNIIAGLVPESDDATKWASEHSDEYSKLETLANAESDIANQAFAKKYPLLSSLPYKDAYYTIDYKLTDDGTPIILISTESPQYRYVAFQKVYSLGYNPADYVVDFTDYTNPLTEDK